MITNLNFLDSAMTSNTIKCQDEAAEVPAPNNLCGLEPVFSLKRYIATRVTI